MSRTVRYADPTVNWVGGFEPMTRDGITRSQLFKSPITHLGECFGADLYAPGTGKKVRKQLSRRGRYACRRELKEYTLRGEEV